MTRQAEDRAMFRAMLANAGPVDEVELFRLLSWAGEVDRAADRGRGDPSAMTLLHLVRIGEMSARWPAGAPEARFNLTDAGRAAAAAKGTA